MQTLFLQYQKFYFKTHIRKTSAFFLMNSVRSRIKCKCHFKYTHTYICRCLGVLNFVKGRLQLIQTQYSRSWACLKPSGFLQNPFLATPTCHFGNGPRKQQALQCGEPSSNAKFCLSKLIRRFGWDMKNSGLILLRLSQRLPFRCFRWSQPMGSHRCVTPSYIL